MARATFLRLSNGSRGLQGLQALTPRYWPPLGAFIKLPALRVVHDFSYKRLLWQSPNNWHQVTASLV